MSRRAWCAIRKSTRRCAPRFPPSSLALGWTVADVIPSPIAGGEGNASSCSAPGTIESRDGLSLATPPAMVRRHDLAREPSVAAPVRADDRARCLARRGERDGQAGLADGADPARPDRHDDHRSRADRPARRRRRGRGRACASDPVPRLRLRHGARLGGGDTRRAGLRRAQAADGAPLAAHGFVGGGHPRRADQHRAAVRRRHLARRRPDARGGDAGGALSAGTDLVR